MKFKFEKTLDREEVVVYASRKTDFIRLIEKLCYQDEHPLIGYKDGIIKELNSLEIECFYTSFEKVYALLNGEEYLVKLRLYELYELLKDRYMYINQGCLVNIDKIDHFDASISGNLIVYLKSGYKDYVSRRQIKNVKERIGIKNEK